MASSAHDTKDSSSVEPRWYLIGNVLAVTLYGEQKQPRRGTKHFPPGTKLYCAPVLWGDGYESIRVVGRHRGSHKYVSMVLPSRYITNWRAGLVYSPEVLRLLAPYGKWKSESHVKAFANWLRDGRPPGQLGPVSSVNHIPVPDAPLLIAIICIAFAALILYAEQMDHSSDAYLPHFLRGYYFPLGLALFDLLLIAIAVLRSRLRLRGLRKQ